jgi:hypothetical protein
MVKRTAVPVNGCLESYGIRTQFPKEKNLVQVSTLDAEVELSVK